jgi:multidrug efflux pump subunit AcrA (membrane-fusion protein)
MFARGEFALGEREGTTLPQSALVLRDGFHWVFVLDAANKVQQRKVSIGARVGERVEVTAGLPAGARVVADGAGFLADGDTVRIAAK